MSTSLYIEQTPPPGKRILNFRGDTIIFEMAIMNAGDGSAWVRTNIGHAPVSRKEVVLHVERDETVLGRDWFDFPMTRAGKNRFRIVLPLNEVGHFEAKCYFLKPGSIDPVWPDGLNVSINVQPADTCCANIIYNAFVRQFGPNKTGEMRVDKHKDWVSVLDHDGFTVIPPTGTFRDLAKELDFIMGELGCRIIQLLPINPIPTTFARMGRYGSPYASLDFTSVDPALAQFDPGATPLEQFMELVDAVHRRNGRILIDLAVNHTGWGAELHETHPQWLARDKEGNIRMPGAWGVIWEDLAQLDYGHQDLWKYVAEVFQTWCKRGVDGFRCDAGYMIPLPAWKYIIARVRQQFPDTLFFLEGLGGEISVTRALLNEGGFNWAYSELFQNYDRPQIQAYLPGADEISRSDGIMVNFAETHDNPRLAGISKTYARMRTALCALCSQHGGFGFANGVEWFAAEKIVIHEANSLNWNASENQIPHIRKLNLLLREHPVFHDQTDLKFLEQGDGNYIALLRDHQKSGEKLLILVNLDTEHQNRCIWKKEDGLAHKELYDLLSDTLKSTPLSGQEQSCLLEPGEVVCLSKGKGQGDQYFKGADFSRLPERIEQQRLKAKVLDVITFFRKQKDLGNYEMDKAAEELRQDPEAFCRQENFFSDESFVVKWHWPRDLTREVMVPPKHFLLVISEFPFQAQIIQNHGVVAREDSIKMGSGSFFVLLSPLPVPPIHQECILKMTVHEAEQTRHQEGHLFYLSSFKNVFVNPVYNRNLVRRLKLIHLATNGSGAMSRVSLSWGEINSRYDAMLAANLHPEYPSDRWVMLACCRAWVVYQGYSRAIDDDCLIQFYQDDTGAGCWEYVVPIGQGRHVALAVQIRMTRGENRVELSFFRHPKAHTTGRLPDDQPVRLILRPDIEDRNFHHTTKAYSGPEHQWPGRISITPDGFRFSPSEKRNLYVESSSGNFVWEPEWRYMVYRALDAQRGLDPDSDLFSPGYFSFLLNGDNSVDLTAHVLSSDEKTGHTGAKSLWKPRNKVRLPLIQSLEKAMTDYVVKRGNYKSVIAGYPWFLDWGRDSLIFTRGLIAAKRYEEALAILKQFGMYEAGGTLPNMIEGENAANRDTSDAPLWFCLACRDMTDSMKNDKFLEEPCGTRTIRDVLLSIGSFYASRTLNGIAMDPESGLIFSPSHFTWMDTNHPAGTPREGYPIEIQALWFAALEFLARIDHRGKPEYWRSLAQKTGTSIKELFYLKDEGYLSDCLLAAPGQPAASAQPDDALRPNQLLAITLGAVRDKRITRSMVTACEVLLIPGAIRSLAHRRVKQPLAIYHQGRLINSPHDPYQGRYEGDEDTRRKPAYHNGTAWTWIFPSFCEAYAVAFGENSTDTALALLGSSERIIREGCVGHVPEITDGDWPHQQRGCDAQAWGVGELYRVLKKLL